MTLHVTSSVDSKKSESLVPHEGELSLMLSKHKKLLLARQMQEEIEQLAWFALHTRGNEIIDSMGRKNPTKHENIGDVVP